MAVNPIHADETVQHVNVRLYFDKDLDHDELLDKISETLQGDGYALHELVSAYELVPDGFGRIVPAESPLA